MSKQDWIVMRLCVHCMLFGFLFGIRFCYSERSSLKAELDKATSENCFLQLRIDRYKEQGFLDEMESMPEVDANYLKEVK